MKEESGVRISEFLDGELPANEYDQLISDVEQAEHQQLLKNYARIGHAIRNESDIYSSIDVSQAVAEAIAGYKQSVEKSSTRNTAKASISFSGWLTSGWFKPAMGAAFASVVAMLTVVVNQNVAVVGNQDAIPAVAKQQVHAPENLDLAQFTRSSDEADGKVAAREELNNYLVNHARSASGNNYQGMVPYVRAVAYEPGQTTAPTK